MKRFSYLLDFSLFQFQFIGKYKSDIYSPIYYFLLNLRLFDLVSKPQLSESFRILTNLFFLTFSSASGFFQYCLLAWAIPEYLHSSLRLIFLSQSYLVYIYHSLHDGNLSARTNSSVSFLGSISCTIPIGSPYLPCYAYCYIPFVLVCCIRFLRD